MATSTNDACSSTMADENVDDTIARLLSHFLPTTVPYSGWPNILLAEIRAFPPTGTVPDWTEDTTPPNWTNNSWDPENETPTNQIKLQWMWEWLEFHELNQSRFNTYKLSIFLDVPWIIFDNVNQVRFEVRPWNTVVNVAAQENRLRVPPIEAAEVPDWLDDYFSSSEAESVTSTTLNNPWE